MMKPKDKMEKGFDAFILILQRRLICSGEKPELLLAGGQTGQQINGRERHVPHLDSCSVSIWDSSSQVKLASL